MSGSNSGEKIFAARRQLRFELLRAVAIAARPRLRPILVPAIPPRMRILHIHELEEFFPIRPLLIERRIAKADFHPLGEPIRGEARLPHVVQIFVAGDRSAA